MQGDAVIRLHDYWRSGAAYRVRIALNLKQLPFERISHDLRTGAQCTPAYLVHNAQGLVPALETPAGSITQSLAILEWLDERYPAPPLLPPDANARAIVRAMALLIACDIHPLNNLRVLNMLRGPLALPQEAINSWIGQWMGDGFAALEPLIRQHGAGFAFGDRPTIADCCLVPQVYSARRFNVPLTAYPAITAAVAAAEALPAFASAAPDQQADADR
jgi:maleylpyruvate isomerase